MTAPSPLLHPPAVQPHEAALQFAAASLDAPHRVLGHGHGEGGRSFPSGAADRAPSPSPGTGRESPGTLFRSGGPIRLIAAARRRPLGSRRVPFRRERANALGVTRSVGGVPAEMPTLGVSSHGLERLAFPGRPLLSGSPLSRVRPRRQACGRALVPCLAYPIRLTGAL